MKKTKFRGIFSGEKGQRVFNILYSVGASVVILGALFKILHFDGADVMLIIGMGTEALIFFLSAFDEQQMGSGESAPVVNTAAAAQPVAPVIAPAETPVVIPSVAPSVVTPAVNPDAMNGASEATDAYIRQLNELNQSIAKLQESLSHNIQGLNAIYELQLRDAGSQLDAVSKVHRETEQMTETIKQLNAVYTRMLEAMTAQR